MARFSWRLTCSSRGIRPAINAGISVSRVGGAAQISGMKKVAGTLRLNLAQFRELEAFAEFGSELDAASLAQLERGARVVETLKQDQYAPLPVEEQVLELYAVTNGHLDDIAVDKISRAERELRKFVKTRNPELLDQIRDTGKLPDGAAMDAAIAAFKDTFEA